MFVCFSFRLFVSSSLCPFVCLTCHFFVCLSVCLLICPSVYVSVYLLHVVVDWLSMYLFSLYNRFSVCVCVCFLVCNSLPLCPFVCTTLSNVCVTRCLFVFLHIFAVAAWLPLYFVFLFACLYVFLTVFWSLLLFLSICLIVSLHFWLYI